MKSKELRETTGKQNAGFTLIELAAAFVVLLILISISVAGIMGYEDYACFNRQNSYAQTLFMAAQTKITGLSVRGQLKDLKAVANHEVDLDKIITPSGIPASSSEVGETAKNGTIYYLIGNRDKYHRYLNGEYKGKSDQESVETQVLYDFLNEFLFEKNILEATIAIEYNPEQGQIYSFFYSDKCENFTYVPKADYGQVTILDRQTDYRSKNMIGYYGLE